METKHETKHETREKWLQAAVAELEPLFPAKYKVPTVRVSTSWPSSKGLGTKKRCIGECWSKDAAADGVCQIFISPLLEDPVDPFGVLPTLLHEVCHAVVGIDKGHRKEFSDCARSVNLEGKVTATFAGEALLPDLKQIADRLGKYPHVRIDPKLKGGPKPQKNRQHKLECACGFICRASRKQIDEVGVPTCGCGKKLVLVEPEDAE